MTIGSLAPDGARQARARQRIAGLYAVTPGGLPDAVLLDRVEQALDAGVRLLQFRAKAADPGTQARLDQAHAVAARCRARGATLIVNDDPALAAAVDADGVHLGRDDGSVQAARALLGPRRLIGISCYDSLARAQSARAEGADYVAFGSVYASSVKPDAVRAPLALLAHARNSIPLPVVAIGGIDLTNAAEVLRAGAHSIAVISAVFGAASIGTAVRQFQQIIDTECMHAGRAGGLSDDGPASRPPNPHGAVPR
jgi:thiamine-phosphate pyrophosphorylase